MQNATGTSPRPSVPPSSTPPFRRPRVDTDQSPGERVECTSLTRSEETLMMTDEVIDRLLAGSAPSSKMSMKGKMHQDRHSNQDEHSEEDDHLLPPRSTQDRPVAPSGDDDGLESLHIPSYNYKKIKTHLPPGFVPGPMDVICAKGKVASMHPGNMMFLRIVKKAAPKYAEARTKTEKSDLVSRVTDAIHRSNPSGGFVKEQIGGRWVLLSDAAAREKVGQVLRDSLSEKYRSSNKVKNQQRKTRALMERGGGVVQKEPEGPAAMAPPQALTPESPSQLDPSTTTTTLSHNGQNTPVNPTHSKEAKSTEATAKLIAVGPKTQAARKTLPLKRHQVPLKQQLQRPLPQRQNELKLLHRAAALATGPAGSSATATSLMQKGRPQGGWKDSASRKGEGSAKASDSEVEADPVTSSSHRSAVHQAREEATTAYGPTETSDPSEEKYAKNGMALGPAAPSLAWNQTTPTSVSTQPGGLVAAPAPLCYLYYGGSPFQMGTSGSAAPQPILLPFPGAAATLPSVVARGDIPRGGVDPSIFRGHPYVATSPLAATAAHGSMVYAGQSPTLPPTAASAPAKSKGDVRVLSTGELDAALLLSSLSSTVNTPASQRVDAVTGDPKADQRDQDEAEWESHGLPKDSHEELPPISPENEVAEPDVAKSSRNANREDGEEQGPEGYSADDAGQVQDARFSSQEGALTFQASNHEEIQQEPAREEEDYYYQQGGETTDEAATSHDLANEREYREEKPEVMLITDPNSFQAAHLGADLQAAWFNQQQQQQQARAEGQAFYESFGGNARLVMLPAGSKIGEVFILPNYGHQMTGMPQPTPYLTVIPADAVFQAGAQHQGGGFPLSPSLGFVNPLDPRFHVSPRQDQHLIMPHQHRPPLHHHQHHQFASFPILQQQQQPQHPFAAVGTPLPLPPRFAPPGRPLMPPPLTVRSSQMLPAREYQAAGADHGSLSVATPPHRLTGDRAGAMYLQQQQQHNHSEWGRSNSAGHAYVSERRDYHDDDEIEPSAVISRAGGEGTTEDRGGPLPYGGSCVR